MIAMRDGNTGERGDSYGARHPGHDLEWNSCTGKHARLFTAAAENKRIAAFQPAHALAFASLLDHEPLDVFLLKILIAGFFSDVDDFCVRSCLFEQVQINEAIVKHNVSFAQARESPHRNEVGISRTGAN